MSSIRMLSVLNEAHRLVSIRLTAGDSVIDATIGNGNDTLFLSRCVGDSGYVYGFDIQDQALQHTHERLVREKINIAQITLTLLSHEYMERIIPSNLHGQIAAIMFNLGYLPGVENSLITMTATTIRALDASLRLLRAGGIITIVVYPGHTGGDEEAAAIRYWATKLDYTAYQVTSYQFLNTLAEQPPYLITVYKI